MCGISGFSDNEYFGNKKLISKFQTGLNHRGPDFTSYYKHNPLTLICNRLSILDLSEKGNQPMVSSSGRFVIVYNGEIYNYRELNINHLNNHNFKSKSDTETILELFENFGLYDHSAKILIDFKDVLENLVSTSELLNILVKQLNPNFSSYEEYMNSFKSDPIAFSRLARNK